MTLMSLELGAWRAPRPHGLRRFVRKQSDGHNAFATERAQRVVSMSELRRADREINHYRRLMRRDLTRQIGNTLVGQSAHHIQRHAQVR